ncbi:MAG: mCpol domain-containing protein [Tolypothrix sp. T3-bin4]|nr:mCpol domain-containing protein [Tolypothrix sp. T3-bin4]
MAVDDVVYGRVDADNIGDKLELLLIRGKIEEAEKLQSNFQYTLKWLVSTLSTEEDFEILFVGCDDILFRGKATNYNKCRLEQTRKKFEELCGCTLSCGVGYDLATALQNLRIAKLEGKNKIIETTGESVSEIT